MPHVDLLIVGAGLSGIGAAHQFATHFPKKTYTVLESRATLGGTWDLFRYPGVRSDSDMTTLGYRFRPWTDAKAIADGPAILDYLRDTAAEHGVEEHIRYGHRVVSAEWSTPQALWTIEVEHTAPDGSVETIRFTAGFLFLCCGYYRYDRGYTPEFPGTQRFSGQLVHPQHWPADLDHAGRRILVIGSGATAVTLVPALARTAAHVTMVQRSPTYVASAASEDKTANTLRRMLPPRAAYTLVRWKNVLYFMATYQLGRRAPELLKRVVRKGVSKQLPPGYDVDTHFKPRYNPFDQRFCLVPDGDLFEALRNGRAEVVTDEIDTFTETGVRLRSGAELPADLIVTATGLDLLVFGGIELVVDGQPVDLPHTLTYKGIMLSGVPNLAFALGYTNASWTLKVDLTYDYVWRLLRYLDSRGLRQCTPVITDLSVTEQPLLDFQAGYVLRAVDRFPKQGSKAPWRLRMNYALDLLALRFGSIRDNAMQFSSPVPRRADAADGEPIRR